MKIPYKNLITMLLVGLVGCSSTARKEPIYSNERLFTPQQIDSRYKILWETVDADPKDIPDFVVHVGARKGEKFSLWVLLNANALREQEERSWAMTCGGAAVVKIEENVYDPMFGTAKLDVLLNSNYEQGTKCTLALDNVSPKKVWLPSDAEAIGNNRFSFAAFSCNEPFSSKHNGILARDISLWNRMEKRGLWENIHDEVTPPSIDFVLGVGDQVYVDPDPGSDNPLSFMEGTKSNVMLIEYCRDDKYDKQKCETNLYKAFNTLYKYNFSAPHVTGALSKVPSKMMWDDHEIRDGWGSHGDEKSKHWPLHFKIARHAFLANQVLRRYGYEEISQEQYDELVDNGSTENTKISALHTHFSHGDKTHFLMLDSRTNRNKLDPLALYDKETQSAINKWFAKNDKSIGELFVLTVGVPLFPSRKLEDKDYKKHFGDLTDDLTDGWGSLENVDARDQLTARIKQHFEENTNDRLLVISGDVHRSGLYFISLEGKIIGQEVITSGIAHALPGYAITVNDMINSGGDVEGFNVTPAGEINHSASFAEIIIDPTENEKTPDVSLVFHTNGTKVDSRREPWVLGNTHLLDPNNDKALWYHPYSFKYKDALAHTKSLPQGLVGSGTIIKLPFNKKPKLKRCYGWSFVFFWNKWVCSAIQSQSVFTWESGVNFNKARTKSWYVNGDDLEKSH